MGIVVLVGGLFVGSLAGCGKKGAPVPPEDPTPAKQETK
jgi:predicted small lipoprotein YifL